MKVEAYLPGLGIGTGVVATVAGAALRSLALAVMGVALVVLSAYKLWHMRQKHVDVMPPSAPPPAAPLPAPAAVHHDVAPASVPPLNAVEPPANHHEVHAAAPAYHGPMPSAEPVPVVPAPDAAPSPNLAFQLLLDRIRVIHAKDFIGEAEAFTTCLFPFYFYFAGCGSDVKLANDQILETSLSRCFHSISSSFNMTNRRSLTVRYQSERSSTAIQAHQLIGGAPNREHFSLGPRLKNFDELENFLFEKIAVSQIPLVLSPLNPHTHQYNYCILGVKKANEKDVVLLIADPNKTSLQEAIYSLTISPYGSKGEIIVKDCSAQDAPDSIESIKSLLCFSSFKWNITCFE